MKNSSAHSEFQDPHSVRQPKQGRTSKSCQQLPTGTTMASGVLANPALWTAGNPCPISIIDALPCCYTPSSCQVERLAQDNPREQLRSRNCCPLTCTSASEKRHTQKPAVLLSTNKTCYTKHLIWLSVS